MMCRIIISAFSTLLLTACGSAPSPKPPHGSPPGADLQHAATETMRTIHESLRSLQAEFPQLRGIDAAEIRDDETDAAGAVMRLSYEHLHNADRRSDSDAVDFAEDGCRIQVDISLYPTAPDAASADENPTIEEIPPLDPSCAFFELPDGRLLAIHYVVQAQANASGAAFLGRVRPLVTRPLQQLWMQSDGVVVDPFGG